MALLLPLLGLLLAGEGVRGLVPPSELKQMSAAGSKYIDTEVENAINGVKQMKTLMDKTSKDHQAMLHTLEETKRRKEEAVRLAREKEQQLAAKQEGCNETMLALWGCKPCLKHTCMRFYCTCHSGSGLVGRQLEELLNHSSPFSIWVNGERIDSLLERDQRQERQFEDLEERFVLEDGVDDIFQDSTQVYGRVYPFFRAPFGIFREAFRPPVQHVRFPAQPEFSRELHPFFQPPPYSFQKLFEPLFEMTRRMLEEGQGAWEPSLGSFASEPRNFSNDRMVCREIRRKLGRCLRMRDECEKCREILSMDCGQADPAQSQLREQLEDALRLAERFTRRYDDLLRAFQAEMLNTTSLLDQLNRQFGWVSRLANLTQDTDSFLQVTTVLSKAPNLEDPSAPPDTQVTVQLFDSEPLSLTVPGDISWDDPRFMEMVAEQALRHYKQNSVVKGVWVPAPLPRLGPPRIVPYMATTLGTKGDSAPTLLLRTDPIPPPPPPPPRTLPVASTDTQGASCGQMHFTGGRHGAGSSGASPNPSPTTPQSPLGTGTEASVPSETAGWGAAPRREGRAQPHRPLLQPRQRGRGDVSPANSGRTVAGVTTTAPIPS
ncbi:LOW QUALITY PROTEIN: clusterin [Leptosomus discolor]